MMSKLTAKDMINLNLAIQEWDDSDIRWVYLDIMFYIEQGLGSAEVHLKDNQKGLSNVNMFLTDAWERLKCLTDPEYEPNDIDIRAEKAEGKFNNRRE